MRISDWSSDVCSSDLLNRELRVTKLQYSVQTGIQLDQVTDEQLRDGTGFSVTRNETVKAASARSSVKYDLLGKVSEATDLLRQTVAEILSGIEPSIFEQYRANPEHFISEARSEEHTSELQ